ncbi:MAG: 30S ribosomal protein S6 [Candidatus Omnitrophota bacterium]
MNNYEAMLLIRPDLSEEEKNTTFSQVTTAINNKKGKIQNAEMWGAKRKLAYKIRSTLTSGGAKKFNEALFYLVNFQVGADQITELRRDFKLNDSIIRVLIIRKGK